MSHRYLKVLFAFVAMSGFAQAPASLEGTITEVLMDHLQFKAPDGSVHTVVLTPGVSVTKRIPTTWSEIHPGDWVGVDSKPGADGSQESVDINVFSPGILAKVRKGQFTMASGDLMTNAPVDSITRNGGPGLVLNNADAMVKIHISDRTTVHRMVDSGISDLKPGVKALVRGSVNEDGSLQATMVSIASP